MSQTRYDSIHFGLPQRKVRGRAGDQDKSSVRTEVNAAHFAVGVNRSALCAALDIPNPGPTIVAGGCKRHTVRIKGQSINCRWVGQKGCDLLVVKASKLHSSRSRRRKEGTVWMKA